MESNSRRKKSTGLDRLKETISQRVETFIRKIGIAITSYCLSFIVLPTLIALTFVVLCLTSSKPANPADNYVPSVMDMFLAVNQHPISMHRFESDWWEEKCYDPENTRQSAHIIVTSKHNVLSERMQQEILRLHEEISEIELPDKVHGGTITYKDVCMSPFKVDNHLPIKRADTCAIDVIIKMFSCLKTDKSLTLNLRMDAETRTLWGVLHQHEEFNASLHSTTDLWCRKQVGKKEFFGQTICMVDDHVHTEAISAGCVRVNYYLKDHSRREKQKARFWLQELEKTLSNFESDLMKVSYVTSETLNIQWWDLVRLTVLNGIIFCLIYFAISLALLFAFDNKIQAVYLSLCAAASLAMTIISTSFFHFILYDTPRFNMRYCVIFISVIHFVFLLVFVEGYVQTRDSKRPGVEAHTDNGFIECYVYSFLSNLSYLFLFSSIFGVSVIYDSLLSFQALCVTSCIGYAVAFFYQVTMLPACLYLYNSRISDIVEKFRFHLATVRKDPMDYTYSVSESVFLDDDNTQNAQNQLTTLENDKKKTTIRKQKKFKSKPEQFYKRFTVYIVRDHMRAVCALLYLTYLSLSCVGTLHFTEGIAPKFLVSKNSVAFNYFTSVESYFKPSGSKFVVYGVVHNNPWTLSVLEELYKIHKSLVEMEAVDGNLSTNWFQGYFDFTVNGSCVRCDAEPISSSNKNDEKNKKLQNLTVRSEEGVESNLSNGHESRINSFSKTLDVEDARFWSSTSINELSVDFWSSFDWHTSWNNFTQTSAYQNYEMNIEIVNSVRDGAHHERGAEGLQVRFRWVYYTIDSYLPSKQNELVTRFQEILKRVDNSNTTMLVFDAPDLDWWTSINAGRFLHSFTSLIVFGLVMGILLLILIKRALVVIWSSVIVVSVCFGIVGLLSLSGIRSDPLSIPCVLFAIPCTIFVMFDMLSIFFDSACGRAESAAASLKKSGPRSVIFCVMLFFCSLTLANTPSYIYKAPLIGLIILALILLLHNLLLVPFLLTVFPPRKKKKEPAKKIPIVKQQESKNIVSTNTDEQTQSNSVVNTNTNWETSDPISTV